MSETTPLRPGSTQLNEMPLSDSCRTLGATSTGSTPILLDYIGIDPSGRFHYRKTPPGGEQQYDVFFTTGPSGRVQATFEHTTPYSDQKFDFFPSEAGTTIPIRLLLGQQCEEESCDLTEIVQGAITIYSGKFTPSSLPKTVTVVLTDPECAVRTVPFSERPLKLGR